MARPGYFHPKTWEDGVMPLEEFGDEARARIERQVADPRPPEKWRPCGGAMIPNRAWYEWHWARGLKLRKDPNYKPRGRRRIPDDLRISVYDRDGWACLHCSATESLSLDHIHPYSLGGEDVFDNLQTLCRPCNSRKGARV